MTRGGHRVTGALLFAALLPASALAAWPLPPDAPPALHADAGSWPSDPRYAESFWLWSFSPQGAQAPQPEQELGVGLALDRAWSLTRGSPGVVVAVIGSGARWESKDLANKWALSRGELPPPQDAQGNVGTGADPHDRNADGRFNAQDFTSASGTALPLPSLVIDPRLSARADKGDVNANGLLDPQDLLRIFGDGVDGDGNGVADDVCGFDFAAGDPDAEDSLGAGPPLLELAAAQADDAEGYAGACPACPILPLRVAPSELADARSLARAVRLSAMAGAKVILVGAQTPSMSSELEEALDAAASSALLVSAPAARPGVRADPLASDPLVLRVQALAPADSFFSRPSCAPATWSGAVAAPGRGCGAEASAVVAGAAGLLFSHAASLGVTVAPLQLKSLLQQTATPPPGAARWTSGAGFGRVNARAALDALSAGRIPPFVAAGRALSAASFGFEPFAVDGRLSSTTPATISLQAGGGFPASALQSFGALNAGTSLAGSVGQVDPTKLSFPPPLLAEDAFANAVSVSLQAVASLPDGGQVEGGDRSLVFLGSDRLSRGPFPMKLDSAGAAAPRLRDLDEDGSDELIVPDALGRVQVINGVGAALPGFPLVLDGGSILAPAAIADLDGDSRPEIAAVSVDGQLAVVDRLGAPLPGYPRGVECGASGCVKTRVYAAPVIAATPLGAVVVIADAEGHVHAFGRDGAELSGSPVPVGGAVVSTPAVGDPDDDGWPDIIVGTAAPLPDAGGEARVRRIRFGLLGLSLDGSFDVRLPAAEGHGVAPLRRGVIASPIIVNLDRAGPREILVRATGGPLTVLRHDGVPLLELAGSAAQPVPVSAAAGDLDGDTLLDVVDAEGGIHLWGAGKWLRSSEGRNIGAAPELASFPMSTVPGPALAGFAIADVDGDRTPEAIFATESHRVFAISHTGKVAEDWPKQLPGGTNAHVAVGVIDNRMVVAALTRDGRLHVWNANGVPQDIWWDGFQHDPGNTGSGTTPLPNRELVGIGEKNPDLGPQGCCSGAPGGAATTALGFALLLLRARKRR